MRAGGRHENRALSGQGLKRREYSGAIKVIAVKQTFHKHYRNDA